MSPKNQTHSFLCMIYICNGKIYYTKFEDFNQNNTYFNDEKYLDNLISFSQIPRGFYLPFLTPGPPFLTQNLPVAWFKSSGFTGNNLPIFTPDVRSSQEHAKVETANVSEILKFLGTDK